MTTTNSLMKLITEPEMRGRVMALHIAVALGGAPVIGWVQDVLGLCWSPDVGSASGIVAALAGKVYLLKQQRDHQKVPSLIIEP
jgi:hypothetical protein